MSRTPVSNDENKHPPLERLWIEWGWWIAYVKVVDSQCSGDKFPSAEAAHDSWWQKYIEMGWQYGPERDTEKKTHPDMVSFDDLPKSERDKDEIFLRLCATAEYMSDC